MKKKRRYWRWLLIASVGLLVLYPVAALIMVWLPEPMFSGPSAYGKVEAIADGMTVEQSHEFEPHKFQVRDGAYLDCRRFVSESSDSIVFVHGVSGFSSQLNKSSGELRDATGAEVFAFDLRGHGNSSGGRGDLDYIGQYEDDLADVIAAVRKMKKDGRIILAAHSMGGGIVQRYATRTDLPAVDAYVLFAPQMGRGLETRTPSDVDEPSAKIHMPRLVGLMMLNAVGFRQLNHEPVLFLDFPPFENHLQIYTFTAVASMFPRNYQAALQAINKPLLVFVGGKDTLSRFESDVVATAVRNYSDGEVIILEDEGHHVQNNPQAIVECATWMSNL